MSTLTLTKNILLNIRAGKTIKNQENYDCDFISSLIHQFQNQYPGSWQDYSHKKMVIRVAAMIRKAAKNEETSVARVVMFYA